MLMEGLIQRHGIPLAVYSDRHAVFKHPGEPRQKLPEPTQFARAMQQLGIRQIFARSPQAKGRVERTAGTFQDRLVTELRLARVETIDDANAVRQAVRSPGGAVTGRQGQHRKVQMAYSAATTRPGAAQLRRSPGGGA